MVRNGHGTSQVCPFNYRLTELTKAKYTKNMLQTINCHMIDYTNRLQINNRSQACIYLFEFNSIG